MARPNFAGSDWSAATSTNRNRKDRKGKFNLGVIGWLLRSIQGRLDVKVIRVWLVPFAC